MGSQGFRTCATIKLSSEARLLASSWCPDKDLLLAITNVGGRDKLSLWPREGARKMWEVEPCVEEAEQDEITGIAWSPDGEIVTLIRIRYGR